MHCDTIESLMLKKRERHVKVMPGKDERRHAGTIKKPNREPFKLQESFIYQATRDNKPKSEEKKNEINSPTKALSA